MKPELKIEIDRLKRVLEENNLKFNPIRGASTEIIAEVEKHIGFTLDEDLKDLWKFTNGSDFHSWFAVFSDELTPCDFPSIEYAFQQWSAFIPYDNPIYEEYRLSENEVDERIQPTLIHQFRFPFAEFNGFSTSVLFDSDPTEKGVYGQIIVYQHDPDSINFVTDNFLEFFRKSNDLLESDIRSIFLLDSD